MKRSYSSLAFAAIVALGLVASSIAMAQLTCPGNTPVVNSVAISARVFNDCPASTFTPVNNYPTLVSMNDTDIECMGWTNLHDWSLSTDGTTPAQFENCSHYKFSCLFNGSANSGGAAGTPEGGLRLSPWWSLLADGRFMARIGGNGEIACFGGRLPFYSFTAAYGVSYVPGTDLGMEIIYNPNSLTVADPATITYSINIGGTGYTSGPIAFDQGNPAEGHGEYGALYPATAGGFFQVPNGSGGLLWDWTAQWKDITFEGPSATPATHASWGQVKTMYR